MKITEEWIREQITKCEKNLEFCKEKGWEELAEKEEWELGVWNHVLFRKIESGRTFHLYRKGFARWKKSVIWLLTWIINKLEGVEDFDSTNPFDNKHKARKVKMKSDTAKKIINELENDKRWYVTKEGRTVSDYTDKKTAQEIADSIGGELGYIEL